MTRIKLPGVVLAFVLGISMHTPDGYAQPAGYDFGGKPTIRLGLGYQSWSVDDLQITQLAAPVSVLVPLQRRLSLEVRTAYASGSGDVENLAGMTNTFVGLVYKIERPDIAFTLGTGLPTGKKELTQEELETSMLVSHPTFRFQAPVLGEGASVNAGAVYALVLGDRIAIGAGVTYHYRGAFAALQGYDEYDPGDEVLVTGGIDVQLGEASNISLDVSFTSYSSDKLGAMEVFSSDNRLVVYSQFSKSFGRDDLWLMARMSGKGKGSVGFSGILIPESEKTEPNQFELKGSYNHPFSDEFNLRFMLGTRLFEETQSPLSDLKLLEAGIGPGMAISPSTRLELNLMFQTGKVRDGNISGFSCGVSLVL